MAQAKGSSFYGGLAWFIISIVTLSYLASLSDQWLELAQTRSGSSALYFRPGSPDTITFWIPTILAMIVLNLRMEAVTKLAVLILLFAAMIGSSAMAMTGYDVVTGDRVLIHSPVPWHRDVRFFLADARVTAKGCHYWHTRSGTHRRIIFQVQGGPGGEQTVDLGDAVEGNLGNWLAVMRGYDDGSLPLAAAAGTNTPHDPDCLRFWSTDLDQQQQAELSRLLS
ncbi:MULTISPECIES: hypothetical protein [unclassified Sphingomonas]|uniref:hypothetical protein n=1 Tax=unclassified Sphingomonas TaxID=196159 RepID=UPI001F592A96|nr:MULTISPECIES: hypothetical protein [unclassified Sphingomonas]